MMVASHLATLRRSQRGLGLARSSVFVFVLFYGFLGSESFTAVNLDYS